MTETLARIRGKADRVRQMVEKTALLGRGSEPYHEEIYLNIQNGQVNTLGSSAGNSAIAFCSYDTSFLDEIESESDDGVEAVINVADFLSYFEFASDGKLAELRFKGDSADDLATSMEIESELLSTFMLPVSDSVREKIPLGVAERFQEGEKWEGDHVFYSNSGAEPATEINTTAESIRRIVEAAEYHDKEFYPITVSDGALQMNVGVNDGRNRVEGTLASEDVSGADVDNNYLHGFPELFDSMSDGVTLRTAPGAPMSVIKVRDGMVLRHVLAPVK